MKQLEKQQNISPELRRFFLLCILLLLGHSALAQDTPPTTTIPAALNYLAPTEPQAIAKAQELDFLHNTLNEHPSNMCGPLSAAILLEIQALQPQDFPNGEVDLSYFWLANPNRLLNLLSEEHFQQIVLENPVWTHDFSQFPLQVGDLIYLEGGTFDHMLVITRVTHENNGQQAYSVTNIYTKTGYTISEELLYDTNDRSVGLFFDEFTRKKSWTGQTGATRTYIFRPKRDILVEQLESTPETVVDVSALSR